MLDEAQTVECQISDAALDELAGVKGTESMARQGQFVALRDAVEGIASDIFEKGPHVKGQIVRIFTKHIRTSPPPDADPAVPESATPSRDSLRIIAENRSASAAQ